LNNPVHVQQMYASYSCRSHTFEIEIEISLTAHVHVPWKISEKLSDL